MRAVIYDPEAPANLKLADVDEPVAADSEALIEVRATALNFGEINFIDRMRKPGEVPGWDSAGVVVAAASDGSGPPVGSRVVGFNAAGGWAQRRAVPTENLAILPDSIDFRPSRRTADGRGDRTAGLAQPRWWSAWLTSPNPSSACSTTSADS